MLQLLLGTADKTEHLLQTPSPFLLIDDGPVADAFAQKFPEATIFNPRRDSFAILRGYNPVRAFTEVVFPDKDLMTYRNGKRALTKLLLDNTTPLTELSGDTKDPAVAEALATIDDLLLSPVLRRVLTRKPNFSFEGSVIAKLDRSQLTEDDAHILGTLLIEGHKGQVVLPDAGFYLRPLHMSLIRQDRLTCSVRSLGELPDNIRREALLFPTKHMRGTTYDDAVELAQYDCKFRPTEDGYNTFIEQAMTAPPAPL